MGQMMHHKLLVRLVALAAVSFSLILVRRQDDQVGLGMAQSMPVFQPQAPVIVAHNDPGSPLVISAERQLPKTEQAPEIEFNVRQHFPNSKWQKTHYAWYKSKIKTGDIVAPGFASETGEEPPVDQIEAEVQESIEASVSLERDLHSYLAAKVSEIESGLTLVESGVEYQTEAGRIDLLARDMDKNLVVVELKAGKAKDSALGQLLGYMGCLSGSEANVRGILVASSFDTRVIFAARGLPNVKLVRYQLSFNLEEVS